MMTVGLSLKEVPALIRLLRILKGWNQKQLATQAGVAQKLLSQYENGKRVPSSDALRRILVAMGYGWSALDAALEFQRKTQQAKR